MKIRNKYRRTQKRLMAILALLTVVAIIAAACGNGEDSVAPAATATSTSASILDGGETTDFTPTPTLAPAPENDETTTPPSDGGEKISFSGADEFVLFSNETISVHVNLDASDTLRVDYKATALPDRGGSLEGMRATNAAIIVTLTDPEAEELELAREGVDERVQLLSGTVETVAGMNGEYLVGFSNPTPIAITVSYEYFVYPVEED